MALSEVLKLRRKRLGLTLSEVAEKIGVSEATVQRWESGNIKNLRHERITKLADVLEISPAELMGWGTEKPTTASDDELSALLRDPLNAEFFEKYKQLNPEHKKMLIAQIQGLLEHRTDK